MAWAMRLSKYILFFIISFFVSPFVYSEELDYSIPCPEIEYDYCPLEAHMCHMTLEQYIDSLSVAYNYDTRVTRLRRFEREAIMVMWEHKDNFNFVMYPYEPGQQLLEWRQRMLPAAYYASRAGWNADKMVMALIIADSTGVSGFREILTQNPEDTFIAYMAQNRANRDNRIVQALIDLR